MYIIFWRENHKSYPFVVGASNTIDDAQKIIQNVCLVENINLKVLSLDVTNWDSHIWKGENGEQIEVVWVDENSWKTAFSEQTCGYPLMFY